MPKVSLGRFRPEGVEDLMRLGRDWDGGYVVSRRAVANARLLISAGINDDWSFEEDFARVQPMAKIVALDASVGVWPFAASALRGLEEAARQLKYRDARGANREWQKSVYYARRAWAFGRFFCHPTRTFDKRFLGETSSPVWVGLGELLEHWAPASPSPASPSVFLKIDVEGGEYAVVPAIVRHHPMIAGVVLEWHDLGTRWAEFEALMDQLLPAFAVAHLHGNNYAPLIPGTNVPSVLEMTLLNKQLMKQAPSSSGWSYPLALDRPCNPNQADYHLTFD